MPIANRKTRTSPNHQAFLLVQHTLRVAIHSITISQSLQKIKLQSTVVYALKIQL